jgi:hypothetical protein
MEVLILEIDWVLDFPIAIVTDNEVVFRLSLLHRSFVQRHQIGVGTRLQLSTTGFIQQVLESTGGHAPPPKTPDIFDKWFLLYRQMKPFLSRHVSRILFLHGLETISDVVRYQQSVGQIHGIGPVTARSIQKMCSTLELDTDDIIKQGTRVVRGV